MVTRSRLQLSTYIVAAVGMTLTAAFVAYCSPRELFSNWAAAALAPYAVLAASAAVARHAQLLLTVLVFCVIAVFVAGFEYFDAFLVHVSGMSGLILVIVPWYQLLAASVLLLVCLLSRLRVARFV